MSQVNRTIVEQPDHPALPVKPPLIFLLAIAAGFGAHQIWPLSVRAEGTVFVGAATVAAGVVLLVWAALTFRAKRTPIEPWKPTVTIADSGPFAFVRNPVYLSFALIQAGIGIWVDRLAVVAMVVPALLAVNAWIVPREERYLERKFGAEYLAYKERVRRWL